MDPMGLGCSMNIRRRMGRWMEHDHTTGIYFQLVMGHRTHLYEWFIMGKSIYKWMIIHLYQEQQGYDEIMNTNLLDNDGYIPIISNHKWGYLNLTKNWDVGLSKIMGVPGYPSIAGWFFLWEIPFGYDTNMIICISIWWIYIYIYYQSMIIGI